MKTNLLFLLAVLSTLTILAQNVYIPDANFKAKLVANNAINTNGDSEIQIAEASAFKGTIEVGHSNISDMTGIEAFTGLTGLYCTNNLITSIDVSANTRLTFLSCSNNKLTSLNVSANTRLTYLNCFNNLLTSLDVSENNALTIIYCTYNQLTSLDVSENTALTSLQFAFNQLTGIDVSENTSLTILHCSYNKMTGLDVSSNIALGILNCDNNQLTSLDVSANAELLNFHCDKNHLNMVNMKNGNNLKLWSFSAKSNPDLSCIQVDDVDYMNENWADSKDETATYKNDCNYTGIEEDFKDISFDVYPNPITNNLHISWNNPEQFDKISIKDLTGRKIIEDKIKLQNFHAVNMSKLPHGIYYVEMKSGKHIAYKTVVKE